MCIHVLKQSGVSLQLKNAYTNGGLNNFFKNFIFVL